MNGSKSKHVYFNTIAHTLFTGRKAGNGYKNVLFIPEKGKVVFHIADNQIVTSSFWLGLLGDYIQRAGGVDVAKGQLSISGSFRSKDELERCLRRYRMEN